MEDPLSEADQETPPGDGPEQAEAVPGHGRRRWLSPASLGTALLLAIMVGAGIFAAVMVTPGPDEEALPRPADADVVVAGAAPLSWDPAAISDSSSAQLLSQVFEGLTVLDATSTLRPALAESWEVEDEGRRVVFTLREGLTFSDGSAAGRGRRAPLLAASARSGSAEPAGQPARRRRGCGRLCPW